MKEVTSSHRTDQPGTDPANSAVSKRGNRLKLSIVAMVGALALTACGGGPEDVGGSQGGYKLEYSQPETPDQLQKEAKTVDAVGQEAMSFMVRKLLAGKMYHTTNQATHVDTWRNPDANTSANLTGPEIVASHDDEGLLSVSYSDKVNGKALTLKVDMFDNPNKGRAHSLQQAANGDFEAVRNVVATDGGETSSLQTTFNLAGQPTAGIARVDTAHSKWDDGAVEREVTGIEDVLHQLEAVA